MHPSNTGMPGDSRLSSEIISLRGRPGFMISPHCSNQTMVTRELAIYVIPSQMVIYAEITICEVLVIGSVIFPQNGMLRA